MKTTREIAEYVGRTYKYGGDVCLAVETLVIPTFPVSTDPAEGASRTEVWEKLVDEHVKRMSGLAENIKTLYSLVWGQCNDVAHASDDQSAPHLRSHVQQWQWPWPSQGPKDHRLPFSGTEVHRSLRSRSFEALQ